MWQWNEVGDDESDEWGIQILDDLLKTAESWPTQWHESGAGVTLSIDVDKVLKVVTKERLRTWIQQWCMRAPIADIEGVASNTRLTSHRRGKKLTASCMAR